ncbi:reverse transcriptase [Plakobranchus ocellatus]|uniref:Reverse transcriptase n=1 Tax=Plakobranchus ocellatus TaxID=259542 RepID=A0AAV4C9W5_9GAST|nr:reverse transcriptase [Plakobranchus ocellatus]
MTILRELWMEDITDEQVKSTYQYVIDLREKMEKVIEVAHDNLKNASKRYKKDFDLKTKATRFEVGNKVLLLLPTKYNKLQLKWQDPFVVLQRLGENNYKVAVGKVEKTYHAKLLKKYWECESSGNQACEVGVLQCAVAALIDEEEDSSEHQDQEPKIETPSLQQTQTYKDVQIDGELGSHQKEELTSLLRGFADVLTDVPGRTSAYTYDIILTSNVPAMEKPYPTSQALLAKFRKEVQAMKLLPRKQRYSVVQKEYLTRVWAVKSLSTYLLGREFVVETDHAPLLYLNRAKSENGRLMRWALLLSQYRFNLRSVKASENHGPNFLSRLK